MCSRKAEHAPAFSLTASWSKSNPSNEDPNRRRGISAHRRKVMKLPRDAGSPARPRAHIVPSVLSADFAYLARDVQMIQKAGAQSVQIDVMDGHFVPNLTVGPIVVECLRKQTSIFLDLHLMIENPLDYIGAFAKAGASLITVHY